MKLGGSNWSRSGTLATGTTGSWHPEQVVIFQRNVEAVCDGREDIVDQVRKTVLHEVGHHFGLDEEDLRELGFG